MQVFEVEPYVKLCIVVKVWDTVVALGFVTQISMYVTPITGVVYCYVLHRVARI